MKDNTLSRRIIAILIAITLLLHISKVYLPMQIIFYLGKYDGFALILVILGWLFFIINAFAAYGLFTLKPWGYGAAYFAIVFSTIIGHVGYLPFFDRLFPYNYASFAALIANMGILTYLLTLQIMQFKASPRRVKRKKK